MNFENEHIAIYELNNKSPLFARIAHNAIANGEYDKATGILRKGIELFEDYPTPYFLLGDLLTQTGKMDEAKVYFQKGNELLNESETFDFYMNKISSEEESEIPNLDERSEEFDSEISAEQNVEIPDVVEETDDNVFTDDSDNLEELADKLQTAKIEVNYDDLPPTNENTEDNETEEFKPIKGLVSETLATIYFNQSNYKEAKAIYETLIEIQPEREEYFRAKISEIESRMRPRRIDD